MEVRRKVQIFGHRGAGCSTVGGGSGVPENSFAAFERAVELGLDGVELDVWLTKDEQVIVLHGGGSDLDGFLYETVVDVGFRREDYHREKRNFGGRNRKKNNAKQSGCYFELSDGNNENSSASKASLPVIQSYPCFPEYTDKSKDSSLLMSNVSVSSSLSNVSSLDETESSFRSSTEASSSHVAAEPVAAEKTRAAVVVKLQGESRLRRIEDIDFMELKRAGQLRLREPWMVFCGKQKKCNFDEARLLNSTTKAVELDGGGNNVSPSRNVVLNELGTECQKERKVVDSEFNNKKEKLFIDAKATVNMGQKNSSFSTISECPSSLRIELSTNLKLPVNLQKSLFERPIARDMSMLAHFRRFRSMTHIQKEDEILKYHENLSEFIDVDNTVLEVPLLSNVFKRFYGRLKFNVELKGSNPLLGLKVLELARPYPGIIARISSFLWNVPGQKICGNSKLSWEDTEEGPKDLLKPLIMNSENISLALLLGGYYMPSIKEILLALEYYNCEWIHLPQSFILSDPDDVIAANSRSAELEAVEDFIGVLKTLPRESLVSSSEEQSIMYARYASLHSEEYEKDPNRPKHFTYESVYKECVHLYYLTEVLHRHNKKVLVYGGRIHEMTSILHLSLLCQVDGLCPNDVSLALELVESLS